ncbi:M16 family metallopeptidase [Altericista sp. CCNU0014]|uniref:M16 family metallopeptidase n=1 Tax=Altericista sp. CCNU0014 TaxID=3082949 RepID=UPI00385177D0
MTLNTLTRGVQKTLLDNGLTVLTKEIHTAPVVSVQVWYRVGSRDEIPGQNGISHQLEHLLFKGTQSRPIQFGRLFSALGSAFNAFTSYDMTAYFGTVSSNKLDALLVLEADRMRHTLINDEQLDTEKRVVISELQGYDNSPEYRLSEAVMRQAFPDRAYGLPVGGTKADVASFTVEQVRDYYGKYYSPNNAVLVVTGDFEPDALQRSIAQTFGAIPSNSSHTRVSRSPTLEEGDRSAPNIRPQPPIHLKQPGSASLIEAVYPIPNVQHPDIPALDVMDAVLSVGRNSRFFQTLIEPGLASNISSYSAALLEPGWYNISVSLIPDRTLSDVDRILLQTIEVTRTAPVSTEELERAKQQLMAHFIMSNREIDNQASQLAYCEIVAGDYRYSDRYLAQIQQVSAADILRVAQTYLNAARRTVGYFEPTQIDRDAETGSVSAQQTVENFAPSEPVDPATVAQYLPPLNPTRGSASQTLPETLVLSNGLKILLLSDRSSPTVTLNGNIQAGNGLDLYAKAGVASLTAETVMGGTATRDATALAKDLEDRGVSLDFSSFREGVEIEGHALAEDLPLLLETLAEVLQEAAFPEVELELSRKQMISSLHVESDDPARLGRKVLQQKIYPPDHPYYVFPTIETVQSITQDDVLAFYHRWYTPKQTILALVGDFDIAQIQAQIQNCFGNWNAQGDELTPPVPAVALPSATHRVKVPLPGKSQAITYMGYPGIKRRDPRYHAAMVLNQVLGGDTLSSRLGAEIRDRQGLTYGIYSYFAAGQQAGPFAIEMQTAPEDTERAVQSTVALLQNLRQNGISAVELSTAKRTLIDSYPVELANPDAVVHRMLVNAVDGFGPEEMRDLPGKIDAVTMEQIDGAIQDLIRPDRLLIVTAGPTA